MEESSVHVKRLKDDWADCVLNKEDTWKSKSRLWGDSVHRMSSYVAMFSPALANYFIKRYTKEGDLVLDTFSGRGTTLLEARLLGRRGFAIDLNPLAYVISRAKSKSFKFEDVFHRIDELNKSYDESDDNYSWDRDMEIFYSKKNLKQISFFKEKLGKNWSSLSDIDNFILAILIGIMHGPMHKDGSSIYLSLSMSNHTSMSKNYVKKYAKVHHLKKPVSDVFDLLKKRIVHVISKSSFCSQEGTIIYGDATSVDKYWVNDSPDLIFTSPPYLNIVNYTNNNWIKMWLLGYETSKDNKQIGLDDSHAWSGYVEFIRKYFNAISGISKKGSTLALVIGDVRSKNINYSFEKLWELIKEDFPEFILNEIYTDEILQTHKATNSMGTKAGKATRKDKVYIFKIK